MVKLFIDSDCDLTLEQAKFYGATMICMPYEMNGKEVTPYKDFEKFDDHAYYDILRTGVVPTTSALSPETYKEYFEPVFAAGDDILYAHFSEAMSCTFNSMRLALEELKEKYPERKLYQVDAKGITIEGYIIVKEICEMYKAGKSVEEILKWAETEVDHYACYFFADDLKFFAKSGRVGGFAAFMGGIIGIRPLLTMTSEGKMEAVGKVKGRMSAITKLVDCVAELGDDLKNHTIVIGHADSMNLAEQVRQGIIDRLGSDLKFEFVAVNPTAGAHCGPNTIGVAFHAIHR